MDMRATGRLAMRDVPRRCGKLPAPLLGGRPFTSARLWAGGRGGVEEVGREIEFRIPQDLENRLPIRGGEPCVYGALFLAREHVPQSCVDGGLRGGRHPVEWRRVNEIAARVLEQSVPQIQVAQRPPLAIARAQRRKGRGKSRRPRNRAGEWRFVDEQQVV